MFSYLALVYDETDVVQSRTAQKISDHIQSNSHGWSSALDTEGMTVYFRGARPRSRECYPLQGEIGVIVGTLFQRNPIAALSEPIMCPRESAEIISSGGRRLIDTHWGSYVAFLCDARTRWKWILRSPAGHLPCYRTMCEGVHIYFSRDFSDADPTPRAVDWTYIAALMVMPREAESTGLENVWKIQPGECLEHHRTKLIRKQYWNPAEIARLGSIENLDAAAAEVRRTAKSCIHAWAAAHSNILHSLSGGLDSSIVLGCLQDSPTRPNIACLNHYSPGHRSDERWYARLSAERAGCKLIEWPRNSQVRLDEMLHISRFPEPRSYFRRIEMSRVEVQFASDHDATALFTGAGGDQLFFQGHARLAVTDYIFHRHFRRLLNVAYDAAQLEGVSIWGLLYEALREGVLPRKWEPLNETRRYQTLIVEERIRSLQEKKPSLPLWMQSSPHTAPGKRRQIVGLTPRSYYDSVEQQNDLEFISPLMSQPLIEVCLRIPTYVSITDGWYRAVARKAFTAEVPQEILRRRSKGGIEEHVGEIWTSNRPFVRELLLDGALVREGLLNRCKLEDVLSDRPSGAMKGMFDIFGYVCIEAWIRKMTAFQKSKAA